MIEIMHTIRLKINVKSASFLSMGSDRETS